MEKFNWISFSRINKILWNNFSEAGFESQNELKKIIIENLIIDQLSSKESLKSVILGSKIENKFEIIF